VIAAIGKAEMVKGSWLKPGAVVIDVGINAVDDATKKRGYRLTGDVDFKAAKQVCSQITPVPGGVGPMTIAVRFGMYFFTHVILFSSCVLDMLYLTSICALPSRCCSRTRSILLATRSTFQRLSLCKCSASEQHRPQAGESDNSDATFEEVYSRTGPAARSHRPKGAVLVRFKGNNTRRPLFFSACVGMVLVNNISARKISRCGVGGPAQRLLQAASGSRATHA
jgi:hypothetical protein